MSFAVLATHVKKWGSLAAFDFRGHGINKNADQTLSLKNLVQETIQVLNYLDSVNHTQTFILVGHSMGGSVACHATIKAL